MVLQTLTSMLLALSYAIYPLQMRLSQHFDTTWANVSLSNEGADSVDTSELRVTTKGKSINLQGTMRFNTDSAKTTPNEQEGILRDSCLKLFGTMPLAASALQSAVDEYGMSVVSAWPFVRRSSEYEIRAFTSTSCEAFCCPGGTIFVSDYLVELASSSSELECLIAHEMAHWELGHSLKWIRRSNNWSSAAERGLQVINKLLMRADSTESITRNVFLKGLERANDIAGNVMLLCYSTLQEREADYLALLYCFTRFGSTRPFVSFLKAMKANQCPDDTTASEFRTHPPIDQRIWTAEHAEISLPARQLRFTSSNNQSHKAAVLNIRFTATIPYMELESVTARARKKNPRKGQDSTYSYFRKYFIPSVDRVLFAEFEATELAGSIEIPDTLQFETTIFVNKNAGVSGNEVKRIVLYRQVAGPDVKWDSVNQATGVGGSSKQTWNRL